MCMAPKWIECKNPICFLNGLPDILNNKNGFRFAIFKTD